MGVVKCLVIVGIQPNLTVVVLCLCVFRLWDEKLNTTWDGLAKRTQIDALHCRQSECGAYTT